MKGKDKCKILKELRAQIAAANDIVWVTENCTHKGECRGTCPKCEAEVAMLERALERRRALGKTVAVAGLAVGMIATTTSCALLENWQATDGDMLPPEQTTTADKTTATTTEEIEVEVDGMMMPGEFDDRCYYSDFTLFESQTYESTEEIYFESVMGSDGEISPSRSIAEGVRFDVIGETDYYWLISYEDSYYCVWKEVLDECAAEVQADTTVDDSDDSAAEDGQ